MKNLSDYPQLFEIARILYGRPLKKNTRTEGIYPVFGSGGCIGYHNQRSVASPTIIIGRKGSVGNIIFSENGGWPIDTTFYVEPKISVNIRYLYWALKSLNLSNLAISTSLPGLNRDTLYKQRIYLPSENKQSQIASILDELEELLKKQRQALELTKQMIPALFYEIQEQHVFTKLENICNFEYGLTATAQDFGEARFIRITDINSNCRLNSSEPKYVKLTQEISKYTLKKEDILVARTGATYGKTLIFEENYPAIFASYLIRINFVSDKILPYYYWLFSQTEEYWKQARSLMAGTGQQQFNANAIKNIKIPTPSLMVQKNVTAKLQHILDLEDHQKKSLLKLDALFESLLQQTFLDSN